MKIKSPAFSMVKRRILFIFNFAILSFIVVTKVDGQTIVGKWKEQTDVEYFAKGDGTGHTQPHPPFNGQFQVLEIKSDQTFTSTEYMNWIPGVVAVAGSWSLAGDQLKTKTNNINIDYALNVYTMKQESDLLVLSLKQPKGSGVSMMEKRYKKM